MSDFLAVRLTDVSPAQHAHQATAAALAAESETVPGPDGAPVAVVYVQACEWCGHPCDMGAVPFSPGSPGDAADWQVSPGCSCP